MKKKLLLIILAVILIAGTFAALPAAAETGNFEPAQEELTDFTNENISEPNDSTVSEETNEVQPEQEPSQSQNKTDHKNGCNAKSATVSGTSRMSVDADSVSIYFSLDAKSESAQDAKRLLSEKSASLKQAMKEIDDSVTFSAEHIYVCPVWDKDKAMYEANMSLTASGASFEKGENLLKAAEEAGARYCSKVAMLKNKEAAYKEALAAAKANAESKAIALLGENCELANITEKCVFDYSDYMQEGKVIIEATVRAKFKCACDSAITQ